MNNYLPDIQSKNSEKRLTIIDSFRGIAILMVVLFHFFSRYLPPKYNEVLYPYGYDYCNWFRYGYLGVHLFFIISGFVIFYSLEKTDTFKKFIVKRWIRLFPSMLICSVITFLVINYYLNFENSPFVVSVKSFLPSLLFINAKIFSFVTGDLSYKWINGSYWTLWIEVQFYVLAAIVFFKFKKSFFDIISYLAFLLYCLYDSLVFIRDLLIERHDSSAKYLSLMVYFLHLSELYRYLPLFCLGMIFYCLSKKKNIKIHLFIIQGLLMVRVLISEGALMATFFISIFVLLFIIFVYKPLWLNIINFKLLNRIGLASYGLYLIHESIGVSLIHKYADQSALFPTLLIIILCLVSFYYYKVEIIIITKLNKLLIK